MSAALTAQRQTTPSTWPRSCAQTALRAAQPGLPIVVVSFLPQPATWMALEPAAYVLKPFTVVQLETAVESALPARQSTAA